MKKTLIAFATAVTMCFSAHAQLTDWGARVGFGSASVVDDLLTKSPVLSFEMGGYVNYGFEEMAAFWADNLFLQGGLNFQRRGCNFEQVWTDARSYREGFYHLWYAELPVLIGWKTELPLQSPDHYINFYVGPSVSVGLFGRIWDRHVTPGYPQLSVNYDTFESSDKSDRQAFKHVRRFDVSSRIGIGYKYHQLTVDLFWQHGFIALMRESDVLRTLDDNSNNKPNDLNSYTGTNNAFTLSVGYTLPLR